jgi:hypothetical protein
VNVRLSRTRMLSTERVSCKGVNPFCSHLQDKHHRRTDLVSRRRKKAGSKTGFSWWVLGA